MSHVREILRRPPPPTLYHYTNQAGLLGIIRSKEIWASHTQYLNDREEFRHAIGIAKEVLFNMRLFPPHAQHRDILDQMEKSLEGIESINVCVCSFSERGDILSQWRAYGGGSGGFSIGFDGQLLRRAADAVEFWLVPCLYEVEDQKQLIQTLIQDVLDEILEWRQTGNAHPTIDRGGNLVAYLNRYAPIVKHKSFAEEKEWRIISRPLACGMPRFDYRPGTSMLIPFYTIPLTSDVSPFEIKELVVGPTPHPTQSKSSAEGLLYMHNLHNEGVVKNSLSPYRNW